MKTEEEKHKAAFMMAVKQLQKVVKDAKAIWPDANLYLASGTLNFMKGEHHSEPGQKARYDNVLASVIFNEMDGGDW